MSTTDTAREELIEAALKQIDSLQLFAQTAAHEMDDTGFRGELQGQCWEASNSIRTIRATASQITVERDELKRQLDQISFTLRHAKTLRGDTWIIRYEEHGLNGPGYYAMHDFWEGGSIGPYATILEADTEMNKALEPKK
jgi:hypothetical protein